MTVTCRRGTALAHAKALTRLRPWRHASAKRTVERWHLDACAKRGLVYRNRHADMQIVAFTPEAQMGIHLHVDVHVTRLAERRPIVPFSSHA